MSALSLLGLASLPHAHTHIHMHTHMHTDTWSSPRLLPRLGIVSPVCVCVCVCVCV